LGGPQAAPHPDRRSTTRAFGIGKVDKVDRRDKQSQKPDDAKDLHQAFSSEDIPCIEVRRQIDVVEGNGAVFRLLESSSVLADD